MSLLDSFGLHTKERVRWPCTVQHCQCAYAYRILSLSSSKDNERFLKDGSDTTITRRPLICSLPTRSRAFAARVRNRSPSLRWRTQTVSNFQPDGHNFTLPYSPAWYHVGDPDSFVIAVAHGVVAMALIWVIEALAHRLLSTSGGGISLSDGAGFAAFQTRYLVQLEMWVCTKSAAETACHY